MADNQGLNGLTAAEHIGAGSTGDNIEAKRVAMYVWDGNNWQRAAQDGSGVIPTASRTNIKDQNTTITSSTSATTIVTADTTHYLDLVSLVLTNTSATGTEVQLLNDDGTTLRSVFYCPANDTRGIVFSTPFTQTAGNTPFYAGANGVLVSGDTNWLAQAAPSLGGTLPLMGVG